MTDVNKPVFFKSNRVRRIYTGGAMFSDFFGDNSTDGFYPEEWVCSVTKALNLGSTDPKEGIAVTEDGDYFDDVIQNNRESVLGNRNELGVLVKMLDSAIRLPVQCHPDKAFSRKFFHSEHGKAESWVILATRPGACIYFGFKEKISLEKFEKALDEGDEALKPLLNKIDVKPGDVFFIPAKAVHAIGEGCMLLETQEPTDFTIQPEKTCGDYVLADEEKYLGINPSDAMSCFDMDIVGEYAESLTRKFPKTVGNKQYIITQEDTDCFGVNRYILKNDESEKLQGTAIYVVTEGSGKLVGEEYCREIKKGDYFFMPCICHNKFKLQSDTEMQVVQCLPPEIK